MVSVGSLRNMVTANGHSSNGNDDKIDLTGSYGIKIKPEKQNKTRKAQEFVPSVKAQKIN